ncbi:MAG: TIGR03085 family metal-binding protein [Janthinobacterium lividum]
MSWVAQEQEALVQTLRAANPDASTLCDGWDVRRLLAHLVQREQDAVGGLKDTVARKPPGQEPGLSKLTGRARSPYGYARLIDRFAAGAPAWSPMSWASEKLNFVEYVIHHEDVRRGGSSPLEPRTLPGAEQDAVWQQLGLFAKLGLRRSPVGVRLATTTGESRVVKAGDGVTLTGEPVELALWVSGRREAARVAVTGSPDVIERYQSWANAS